MTKTLDSIAMFLKVTDAFPELKEHRPETAKGYFEFFCRYAPTVASEPLLISPLLKSVLQMGVLDPVVMLKLIELERSMRSQTL